MARNRLTWQNVAAPDFRGVGQNYETMSRLLGNAAQAGEGMLDVFRDAHQHAADRNILQRQIAAPDAASYDPSSVIGSDGSYASLDTLRGVGNHVDTLINRQVTGDTHAQNQRDWNWLNTGRDQTVANAGFLNEATAKAAQGDLSFLNDPRMQSIRPDLTTELISNASSLATSSLSRDNTRQNMEHADYRQGRQVRADELTDMTQQVYADMINNGYNLDTWDAYLASRTDLPPEVANAAYSEMMRLSGPTAPTGGRGGAAAGAGGGGGGGVGTGGVQIGERNPLATYNSNVQVPVNDPYASLHAAIPGLHVTSQYRTPERNAEVGGVKGSRHTHNDGIDIRRPSAQQATEIRAWADQNGFRIKNDYSDGHWHLEPKPDHPLRTGATDPAQNDPAQELLTTLGQRDPGRSFRQNVGATAETGRQSNVGTTGRFLDLVTTDMNEVQVAAVIAEQLGDEANIPGIEKEIRKIRERSAEGGRTPITYAEAGDILMRSLSPTSMIRNITNRVVGTFDMLPFVDVVPDNPLRSSIGAGRAVDTDRLNANLEDVISGASETRLGNVEEMARRQAAIAAAEQDRDLAQQRLLEAARAAERRPGIAQHLPRLEQAYQQAVERVGALSLAAGMENSRQAPPEIGQDQSSGGNQTGSGRETLPPETSASTPSVADIQRAADPSSFNSQDWEAANAVFERRDRGRTDPSDSVTVARIREASNSPQEFVTNLESARQRLYEGGVSRGERPILRTINRELSRITDAVVANRDIDDSVVAPREGRSTPPENRAAEVLQTATAAPGQAIGGQGYVTPPVTQESVNRGLELIRKGFLERAAIVESMPENNLENYARRLQPQNASMGEVMSMLRAIRQTNDPDRKIALMRQLQDSVRNPVI